jgi:hypothetical protein
MTIDSLLNKSNNKLYLRNEDSNSYEDLLFKAKMIPVISGYIFAASSFCYKYADDNNIQVIELGTKSGNEHLFETYLPEQDVQQYLQDLLQLQGDELLFTQFAPQHIGMIIIDDQEVLLKKRIEQDQADEKIGRAALVLAKMHTQTICDNSVRKVYINMYSPLIQCLIELKNNKVKSQQLGQLLRSFTITLCHNTLDETVDFNKELKRFSQVLVETFAEKTGE